MISKKRIFFWVGIGASFTVFGLVVFLLTKAAFDKDRGEIVTFQTVQMGSGSLPALPASTDTGPETAQDLSHRGDQYFENGKFPQAIELYKKSLTLDPKDVDTLNDLGLALHYTGDSEGSIEILRKGTKIQPSFQRIWLSLGFVLKSMGRNSEAKEALGKAADIDPKTAQGQEALKMLGL